MEFPEWLENNKFEIMLFYIALAMVFIIIGHKYRDQVQSVLKKEFVKFPEASLDWWSITHFVLFFTAGLLIPNHPLTAFAVGTAFELGEDYLSSDSTTLLADCKKSVDENGNRKTWCNGYNDGYWYMNPTDPWVNLTGYILGSAIRTTFFDAPSDEELENKLLEKTLKKLTLH